jgi:hypothetical protein
MVIQMFSATKNKAMHDEGSAPRVNELVDLLIADSILAPQPYVQICLSTFDSVCHYSAR